MESERHVLLSTAGAELVLWDTPGFGDSARLLARLRKEKSPVGWFLHQVWDRLRDRPLWLAAFVLVAAGLALTAIRRRAR